MIKIKKKLLSIQKKKGIIQITINHLQNQLLQLKQNKKINKVSNNFRFYYNSQVKIN